MARFEGSRDRRDSPRRDSSRGGYSGRSSDRGGYSGRGPSRDRREPVVKTKVICSSCGTECEVPFKPTSSKPVYCDDCFAKKDNKGSNDFNMINEKLDKIMKALKIE